MQSQKQIKSTKHTPQKIFKTKTLKHDQSGIMKSKQSSPVKNTRSSYLKNEKTKTAPSSEIQELAEKHYQKAMKYVYKKNQVEEELKKTQQIKNNPQIEQLTEHHTFHPMLISNKYNRKIQQRKKDGKKQNELTKWGINHTTLRRERIIKQQTKTLKYSLEKQKKSLQNSRISSISKSIGENSVTIGTIGTAGIKKQKTVSHIPGVKKFYLNQVKAQVAKEKNQKLLFRGDQLRGYQY